MNIQFHTTQCDLTPALREFTTSKFDRLLRHFDKITRVDVSFAIEKLTHIVEATIHVAKTNLHAKSTSEVDMNSAVDVLIDKLDRQVVKHKEKLKQHRDKSVSQ